MQKLLSILLKYIPLAAFLFAAGYALELSADDEIFRFEVDSLQCGISFGVLVTGLVIRGLIWHLIAWQTGTRLPISVSRESQFQPVLAKYIPGKVWRYISSISILKAHGVDYRRSVAVTLLFQLVIVASGLALSSFYFGQRWWAVPAWTCLWLGLCYIAIRLWDRLAGFARSALPNRLEGALSSMPTAPPWPNLVLWLTLTGLNWLVLSAGFLLFYRALGVDASRAVLFLQPLANISGLVAFFAPGGLGIREFATTAYLELLGIALEDALALALLSRLWFLAAEVVLYLLGALLGKTGPSPQSS